MTKSIVSDYKIKVYITAKFYEKCFFKTFNNWNDFTTWYDTNKYYYSLKVCESYNNVFYSNGVLKKAPVLQLLFSCGKYSRIRNCWDNFLDLNVNPERDKDLLRVFRHVRLDYLPSNILYTFERIKLFKC